MTEEQFDKYLTEDEWFEDPQLLLEHRVPIVQHFITFHTNRTIFLQDNGVMIPLNSRDIILKPANASNTTQFTLINRAYTSIKEWFDNGKSHIKDIQVTNE